jgi:glutamine synthetase
VNPYLALAAMAAGALHGLDNDLTLEEALPGNAYVDSDARRVPSTLSDALRAWEGSQLARRAFGDQMVDHYTNNARVEIAAYDAAVTDWELFRGFERL